MSNAASAVSARLEADRRDLLDLSLRNPLLNYRPRARGLEVVGESPARLFQTLVHEGKRMAFLPAPGVEAGGAGTLAQPEEASGRVSASQADLKLQTRLPSDQLQSRLLAIFHAARTSLEEQGVNTLFLALGMLHWSTRADPRGVLRAPLLLIPVELERSSARERFRIRPIDEDLEFNLSLAEKLRADFEVAFPELPESAALDVGCYFGEVATAVAGQPGWAVDRESVVLGFFSFGKFLMYHDLDEDRWPPDARPGEHPILRALLHDGFAAEEEPRDAIEEDAPLDAFLEPSRSNLVVDADSSQTLAVLDVNRGHNLVIQGPPGTGKSQTITNLIAEAIGRGKSVLFVAEKMAALEVVKRRLDAVGLGDACLELHSHKASKKAVLEELRRTLGLGRPKLGPVEEDLRMLGAMCDRLNAYCEAVNTPVGASGVTPFRAFGELLRLRERQVGATPRPLEIPAMPSWSRLDLKRRQALVEELQSRMSVVGVPREHPFWGSRRTVLLPTEGDRARDLLLASCRSTSLLRDVAARLAAFLHLPPAANREELEILVRAARRASKADQVHGADLRSEDWLAHRGDLEELLDAGAALAEIHRRHDPVLLPEAWDQDLQEARRDLNVYGRSWWWRPFSGGYRRARRSIAAICRGEPPRKLDDQLALIDAVIEARRRRDVIRRHEPVAARLFGPRWQGERSHWEALAKLTKWAVQLHHDVRAHRLPGPILDFLAGHTDVEALEPRIAAVRAALAAFQDDVGRLAAFLEFDAPARFGEVQALEDLPLDDLEPLLAAWVERIDELPALVAFNHLAGRCREDELGAVVAIAESWPEAGRHLLTIYRRHWFEVLLKQAFRERPALAGFNGPGHEHVIRAFRDLDRQLLRHTRARLALEHWQRLPRHEGPGQLGILRREFEKKARHMPLRQLLSRAGNAVMAIKPVFMMSPLSIATYLAPGGLQFDLVIFDEASQVKPVDALGAILRGRQAVVVGDSQQLPPTSFFDRLTGGDEEDDDEASGDVESVLGLFVAQGAPQRMLRWHYRSRHESLIAVSNREFYDDRLVVFPSPDAARRDAGLVVRRLPEAVYDRGGTRTNPGEAEAVARAVIEHAQAQRDRAADRRLTLGVVAFSVAQMNAIQVQLERLRRDDPSCEEFFALGVAEPFFVKNLENVQGDERDVIFISVGYGRTADGDVALNFGPLNGEGGERRLNVLITRARLRCEVFTNLTADDLDLDRARSRGVRALKTFLDYAETGTLEHRAPAATGVGSAPGAGGASPFEEAVRAALVASGCEVRPRVGSAGFALDMAVVDPDRPGRYLLGIECDGASYHEARSARDRDRLRPQVLESLGWRLHRVWSADWGRNPSGELKRTLAAIDAARGGGPSDPEETPEAPDPEPTYERDAASGPGMGVSGVPAYRMAALNGEIAGVDLESAPTEQVVSWVAEVVAAEGPIHVGEVARRLVDTAGARRAGARVSSAIESAWTHALDRGTIARRGDFLWPSEMDRPPLRDRGALPSSSRKLELVAPEEIAMAVEKVVADALGIEPDAIPTSVCRLLGFSRVSDEMRERVGAIVQEMLAGERLAEQGEHLVVPEPLT